MAECVPFVTVGRIDEMRSRLVHKTMKALKMGGDRTMADVQLKTTVSPTAALTCWGWKIKLAS